MSGALPLQVLSGAKTQTRRVIPARVVDAYYSYDEHFNQAAPPGSGRVWEKEFFMGRQPYGAPGDRLYVRETHYRFGHWEPLAGQVTKKGRKQKWGFVADDPTVIFDAPPVFRKGRHHKDPATPAWHKRLARFMAKASARTILEVVEVRVQRLHEISEADATAEGVTSSLHLPAGRSAVENFMHLWESINGEGAWETNPWVWAITFKIIKG